MITRRKQEFQKNFYKVCRSIFKFVLSTPRRLNHLTHLNADGSGIESVDLSVERLEEAFNGGFTLLGERRKGVAILGQLALKTFQLRTQILLNRLQGFDALRAGRRLRIRSCVGGSGGGSDGCASGVG